MSSSVANALANDSTEHVLHSLERRELSPTVSKWVKDLQTRTPAAPD